MPAKHSADDMQTPLPLSFLVEGCVTSEDITSLRASAEGEWAGVAHGPDPHLLLAPHRLEIESETPCWLEFDLWLAPEDRRRPLEVQAFFLWEGMEQFTEADSAIGCVFAFDCWIPVCLPLSPRGRPTLCGIRLDPANAPCRFRLRNLRLAHRLEPLSRAAISPIYPGVTGYRPAPALEAIHLRNAMLLGSRREALECYPRKGVVAELGVLAGDFSQSILDVLEPERLYLLDIFGNGDAFGGRRFSPETHYGFVRERFSDEIATGRVCLRKGNSWEQLALFPDAHFDLVYVDASHSYEDVKRDLTVAGQKVKPGGYIGVDDYTLFDWRYGGTHIGVVPAVNEFCLEYGWEIAQFVLSAVGYHGVGLTRIRPNS